MVTAAANGHDGMGRRRTAGSASSIVRGAVLSVLGAFVLTVLACGGDSDPAGLTCGPGTTANGGACTPACGSGTTFDATTKTCVAVGGGGASGAAGSGGSAQSGAAGGAGSSGFPEGHPCGPLPGMKRIINCNPACGALGAECSKFQCTGNVEAVSVTGKDIPLAVRVGGPLPTLECTWLCTLPGGTASRLMMLPFDLSGATKKLWAASTTPGWAAYPLLHPASGLGWVSCGSALGGCQTKEGVPTGFALEPLSAAPGEGVVTLSEVNCE